MNTGVQIDNKNNLCSYINIFFILFYWRKHFCLLLVSYATKSLFVQGTVELDDQIEVLQWLADRLTFLDMDRVAIHGWSYGGYISLMALATKPHIFKVSIFRNTLFTYIQVCFEFHIDKN